jgi:hypothetical protein
LTAVGSGDASELVGAGDFSSGKPAGVGAIVGAGERVSFAGASEAGCSVRIAVGVMVGVAVLDRIDGAIVGAVVGACVGL